jgi:hypothetical protein
MKRAKREFLNRYERTPEGKLIIDVAAPKVEDLYEFYDKTAPYVKRDLDPDLVDYLIACAKELRTKDFMIRFTLQSAPGDDSLARVKHSVANFFHYLAEVERDKTRSLVRRSLLLLGIGLGILSISVWVNTALGPERGVVANVFAEGLTVAAWVSLWEALATFLIDWGPHRRRVKLYGHLATASLVLGPASAETPPAEDNTRKDPPAGL